jgi:hypothetical protein
MTFPRQPVPNDDPLASYEEESEFVHDRGIVLWGA